MANRHRQTIDINRFSVYKFLVLISTHLLLGPSADAASNFRVDAGDKECWRFPKTNGRLEVLHDGQWGSVCSHGWGVKEATVACRSLGFQYGINAQSAYYAVGEGKIWLNNVKCNGSEKSLFDCQHDAWGDNKCFHQEDVAVWCGNYAVAGPLTTSSGTSRRFMFHCDTKSLPGTQYSWFKDCDLVGNQNTVNSGSFQGPEPLLWICEKSVGNQRELSLHYWYINKPYAARLVGDETVEDGGRLEVYYDGAWGTVCDRLWGTPDSNKICEDFGFRGGENVRIQLYGEGSGHVWTPTKYCIYNNPSSSGRCLFNTSLDNCGHENDVALKCSGCGKTKWLMIEGLPPGNDPIYGKPGDQVRLKCRRSKCGSAKQIKWVKTFKGIWETTQNGGDGINTMTSFLTFTFNISEIKVNIRCQQEFQASSTKTFLTQFGPESVEITSQGVNGSTEVKIKCTTSSSQGNLAFKWLVDGRDVSTEAENGTPQKVTSGGEIKTSIYTFRSVWSPQDTTTIKCVVTNPGVKTMEAEKKIVDLMPFGPESVVMKYEKVPGSSQIKLKCAASSSIGELYFSWFVDGKDVSEDATTERPVEGENGRKLRTSVYAFFVTSQSAETDIKCVATNPGSKTVETTKKLLNLVSGGINVVHLSKEFLCFISFLVYMIKHSD